MKCAQNKYKLLRKCNNDTKPLVSQNNSSNAYFRRECSTCVHTEIPIDLPAIINTISSHLTTRSKKINICLRLINTEHRMRFILGYYTEKIPFAQQRLLVGQIPKNTSKSHQLLFRMCEYE